MEDFLYWFWKAAEVSWRPALISVGAAAIGWCLYKAGVHIKQHIDDRKWEARMNPPPVFEMQERTPPPAPAQEPTEPNNAKIKVANRLHQACNIIFTITSAILKLVIFASALVLVLSLALAYSSHGASLVVAIPSFISLVSALVYYCITIILTHIGMVLADISTSLCKD